MHLLRMGPWQATQRKGLPFLRWLLALGALFCGRLAAGREAARHLSSSLRSFGTKSCAHL